MPLILDGFSATTHSTSASAGPPATSGLLTTSVYPESV